MRRPNSERNSAPSAFTGPRVSKAMGTNTWVAGNNAYLAVLRLAACSAAEPAEIAVCDKYDATSMMQHKCGPLWHPRPCIFQQGMNHRAACHRFAEVQMVPSCLEHLHFAVNAK